MNKLTIYEIKFTMFSKFEVEAVCRRYKKILKDFRIVQKIAEDFKRF